MFRKKPCFVFLVLSLFYVGVSYAELYLVTAQNEVPNMNPSFWVTDKELTVQDNNPIITVEFTGNCAEKVVNQCDVQQHNDHYDWEPLPRTHHHGPSDVKGHYHKHSSQDSCRERTKLICEHQEGKFRLPADRVIFDGDKRWKFIGDEVSRQYLTIARNDRSGFTRTWQLRTYVELNVAPNGYQSLTLTIHPPTE